MRELTPELRALRDLARAASEGTGEVEDLLRRVCASVAENFGFERVSVGRYFPDSESVVPLVAHNVAAELLPKRVPLATQPLLRRALDSGEAVFVEDVREDPVLSADIVETFGVRSVLAVPLVFGGECLGFLTADRGGTVFRLERSALDLLTTIGAITAVFAERAFEHRELRRLDELKTNFIALASHELRTPVAVVHGIASTLALRGENLTNDQLSELRRTLQEQTDRLRGLVDQLLDLSRLEADGIQINPEPFSPRRRVDELVLTLAGDRARDISVDVPPELETLADPNAFDRIVSNLITNAFRYGEPPVVVSVRQSDRHVRVAVEDRGQGVAPEFVPHLFERFMRSRRSGLEQREGAGLGLSIAQSYAHAHGGEILYRDADPHGACFELVLPRG